MNGKELVEKLWKLFDDRNFKGTKALFHENLEIRWVTSREIFHGADDFIEINENYPGKWRTVPVKVEALHGSETSKETPVFSLVHVFSEETGDEFYVTSFFEFRDGLIYKIEEYWSTVENPPEWRKKYRH